MFACAIFSLMSSVAGESAPATMQAVQAKGGLGCDGPEWPCLSLETLPTPVPKDTQVLLQIKGSSVNPVNIDLVQFPHVKGVIGTDAAGVVVSTGSSSECAHLKAGDEVWTSALGAYAEYAVAPCKATGLKPEKLSFTDAGTMPCVGVTSLECLVATGAPWANRTNVTVVITSGQGGTGFVGIQLAKAYGAAHVVTAATGEGIAYVESLGADIVIDFKKQNIFDALPPDSVDIVYDNYGAKGTADRAMPAIRSGGVYLIMSTGGGGTISPNPKPGVTQISFGLADGSDHATGLDLVKGFFDAGKLQPRTQAVYGLQNVTDAFNMDTSGSVIGKLAIVP